MPGKNGGGGLTTPPCASKGAPTGQPTNQPTKPRPAHPPKKEADQGDTHAAQGPPRGALVGVGAFLLPPTWWVDLGSGWGSPEDSSRVLPVKGDR